MTSITLLACYCTYNVRKNKRLKESKRYNLDSMIVTTLVISSSLIINQNIHSVAQINRTIYHYVTNVTLLKIGDVQ